MKLNVLYCCLSLLSVAEKFQNKSEAVVTIKMLMDLTTEGYSIAHVSRIDLCHTFSLYFFTTHIHSCPIHSIAVA